MVNNIKLLWKKCMLILTKNQKWLACAVFIMSLVGAVMETVGVSVFLPFVQAMLEPEEVMKNPIIELVCRQVGVETEQSLLYFMIIGIIVIYVIKNFYLSVLSACRANFSAKVQREISVRMLESYMKRGYSFFKITNTSNLLRGVGHSVASFHNVILCFMKILAELLTICFICAYIIIVDWQMAMYMLCLVGLCLVLVLSLFKGMIKRAGKQYHEGLAMTNKWSIQLFSGIKELLVLDRKDYFIDNYKNSLHKQQKGMIKQNVASEMPSYIIEAICISGLIISVCIRCGDLENLSTFIPQLASFAVAAFRILPSIGRVSSIYNTMCFYIPGIDEVYENIVESERYDMNQTEKIEEVKHNNIEFEEKLEIKDISWKYLDGVNKVLDGVSLVIQKGEAVAFVGPSGAGKSTLADIVLGLFEPQEGEILIDGKNIINNRKVLSKLISFVPQAVYLIDDTIRRNVAFGIGDENISESMVWEALEKAQMKEFVKALPEGLDTMVGERGVRFSGGQMQRLAIARALYTNPEILVLDEATSALDTETETAVMEAINALQGEKTLIIIAHRLSTIKNCDKIYEIANGRAVERKYEDLVN